MRKSTELKNLVTSCKQNHLQLTFANNPIPLHRVCAETVEDDQHHGAHIVN